MADNSTDPITPLNSPCILTGCLLAAVYWVAEAYLDSVMVENASFMTRLFPSDNHELWMRSLTALIIIGFGLFSHRVHARLRAAELMSIDAAWLLKNALSKSIRGDIPVCALCRKIRNYEGVWVTLEQFVNARTDAEFSTGVCDKCESQHLADKEKDNKAHGNGNGAKS